MRRYAAVLFGLLLVLSVGACEREKSGGGGQGAAGPARNLPEQGVFMAPHFVLPAVAGEAVDSDAYRGRVLLVTFFATWCPPCLEEVPAFIDLQKEFGAQGFSVLGLSVDEGGVELVRRLVEKYGINYPVAMADQQVTRGFGGVSGIPVSFLINREGQVVQKYLGYTDHDVLKQDIQAQFAMAAAAR